MWRCVPLLLTDTRVHGDTWEVALAQKAIKLRSTHSALDEDDDLVVVELIEDVVETTVLLRLAELDVVLLQTVEGELGLVIDVDLQRVLHELLADRAGGGGERGRKHHDLFLGWRGTEDLLNVAAHVWQRSQYLGSCTRW